MSKSNFHEPLFTKFGAPKLTIHEYSHWTVLVRKQQITLGSLVILGNLGWSRLSDVPVEAFAELKSVIADIESCLAGHFQYDKINYLCLMMVDPFVHLHAIPRYSGKRNFQDQEFVDSKWPSPPDVLSYIELPETTLQSLVDFIRRGYRATR